MNYKQLLQRGINTIDALLIPAIMSTYHKGAHMTTWAIQPTHYGNEVKIWADVFHNDHFVVITFEDDEPEDDGRLFPKDAPIG